MSSGIWIPRHVVAWIVNEAEEALPNETGGVLLGYRVNRTDDLVVTRVVGPGPHAQHETHMFVPDATYHEAEIARHYHHSGRIVIYLGDWHSHPRSKPYLSRRDLRTLRAISRFEAARLRKPAMVVVGDRGGWSLAAWRHFPGRYRFVPGRTLCLAVQLFDGDGGNVLQHP